MNKNMLFLENFYSLLNAGYSVEEALTLCQSIFNLSISTQMMKKLEQGIDIYSCLLEGSFPQLFKEYFMFYKSKNCLSEAIEKSLNICKTKQNYQNQLKSKLTYPCILLCFLFLFSIFVIVILLPNVNHLFDSFGIKKGILTQIIFFFFYIFPILFILFISISLFMIIHLIYGLRYKKFKIIERYLKYPIIRTILQKYFSLKFAVYYHELALEDMDSLMIINILNQQMTESDMKIVLYEMNNRIVEGEDVEFIFNDFEYLDPLFLTFFKMYMKNPLQHESIKQYIQMTYQQIDYWIAQFIKYFIPCIYGFVAIFVITIYISIIIPMMNVISEI